MNFFMLGFIILASLFFLSCEEKRESHIAPYIAKQQPEFYLDGKPEHILSNEPVTQRLILIGDAGNSDIEPGKSTLKAITTRLQNLKDSEEIIVFLGDNIYPEGFQGNETQCKIETEESKKLYPQMDVARLSRNPGYFIPGNHDWDYHDDPDMNLLIKQKRFLEGCGRELTLMPSEHGKITLVKAQEEELFTMVFLDSHALMFAPEEKQKQTFGVIEGIIELSASEKPIIFFAHHPIATYGPHGGCYQQDYFGSSLINFFRKNGISWGQDINASEYANYISKINNLNAEKRKMIFVGGHDHSLQVLYGTENIDYVLISGTGSHTDPVCHGDNTLFAQETLGHLELGFTQNGKVKVEAFSYAPEKNLLSKVYSQRLY